MLKYKSVGRQKPYKTKNGRWKFRTKWKRGGWDVFESYTLAQGFPSVGFKSSGDGVFKLKKTKKLSFRELDLNASKVLHPDKLTKECLMSIVYFPGADVSVRERKRSEITYLVKELSPSALIKDLKNVVEKCPAYIEKLSLREGKFTAELVSYIPEKTDGYVKGGKKRRNGGKSSKKASKEKVKK